MVEVKGPNLVKIQNVCVSVLIIKKMSKKRVVHILPRVQVISTKSG